MGTLWILVGGLVAVSLAYNSRAMRIFLAIVACGAVLAFPFLQRTFYNLTQSDSSIITNYHADYVLAANGALKSVETFDVKFTEDNKHGIFRIFDEGDPSDASVSHPVTVQSVQRCRGGSNENCVSEPYELYYEGGEKVAKIGRASVTYDAGTVLRYMITSTTTNAITVPAGTDTYRWYWNVIPESQMQIERSSATARLPAVPTDVRCIAGTGPCTAQAKAPTVYTTQMGATPPRNAVTWQADLPPTGLTAVPVSATTPWWKSPWLLLLGVLLAGLLAWLIRLCRERPASTAPVFAAPNEDLLSYTWTWQESSAKEPFQALLLQLRQEGYVDLEVQPEGQYRDQKPDWVVVKRTDKPAPAGIAGLTQFLEHMDLATPGSQVRIDRSSVNVGEKVRATEGALRSAGQVGAHERGFYRKSTAGFFVHLAASACAAVAIVVLLIWQQPYLAGVFAIPAIVAIFSDRSLRTRLTDAGLAARDAVSGLRVALSTPASVERFDYSLKVRYFAQFLPWAVALDCADKWAEACKPEAPEAASDPSYLAARSSYWASQSVSTAVASVSAGAVAAYAATQSSSSGGGGFSAGGGGGGGSSGSW